MLIYTYCLFYGLCFFILSYNTDTTIKTTILFAMNIPYTSGVLLSASMNDLTVLHIKKCNALCMLNIIVSILQCASVMHVILNMFEIEKPET